MGYGWPFLKGENTYNKKTTAYYYYDVRVKTDHENFEKLRGSDILIDGCGTLSFAKTGRDGSVIASRAKSFEEVQKRLPYGYVVLDRSGGFDKFRTVKVDGNAVRP